MPRSVTLSDLIDTVLSQRLAEVRVALPGEVVSYDAAKQEADVRPLVRRRIGEDEEDLPIVPHVPVAHPRGGGFHLSVPLAAGDLVTLIVQDVSHDDLRAGRGTVAPSDRASHHLANAMCYPGGVVPESSELGDPSGSNLVIGEDGGNRIEIKSGGVMHLGSQGGGEDFVALAQKVEDNLQQIYDAIKNAVVGSSDGGATFQTNIINALDAAPAFPEDVATSNVKAD